MPSPHLLGPPDAGPGGAKPVVAHAAGGSAQTPPPQASGGDDVMPRLACPDCDRMCGVHVAPDAGGDVSSGYAYARYVVASNAYFRHRAVTHRGVHLLDCSECGRLQVHAEAACDTASVAYHAHYSAQHLAHHMGDA